MTKQQAAQLSSYTEQQLKLAIIHLYECNSDDENRAYRLAFNELERRIGGEALDAFLDKHGF